MSKYIAPLQEYRFLLNHVFDYDQEVACLPGYEEFTLDVIEAVIRGGAKFAEEVLAPLNRRGDEEGCHWQDGSVKTPAGFKEAFKIYQSGGWQGLVAAQEYGGQELPLVIGLIIREIINSANSSFGTYFGLSQSAYQAIYTHGSEDLKKRFLPFLAEGRWTGTMCLTESHCGSDLSLVKTRAAPAEDGSYRLNGAKIFVTGGDHDMSENILHLVLARLVDAPLGIQGLSLFVVPKLLPSNDGSWSLPNDVVCTGIEHKMGLRASATASLAFEGATGWLIGEAHRGMRAMFTMMNSSRLGVSVQAVGLAEAARQHATEYAKERKQGRGIGEATENGPVSIIKHADVRRNLLTGKAFVEGARALWMWAGMQLDCRNRHPDPLIREASDDLLALLTPVLKAFLSDQSCLAINAAVQVFGGHGYIKETGVEQFIRDSRIIPLYEGTNGIQALDLIHRKITLRGGRTMAQFLSRIEHEVQLLSELRPDFASSLGEALNSLRSVTEMILENAQVDPYFKGAVCHNYLQLFGLVAMGYAWAKITRAALHLKNKDDFGLASSKLKTAHFFFARVLPESEYHSQLIRKGSAPLMALGDHEF